MPDLWTCVQDRHGKPLLCQSLVEKSSPARRGKRVDVNAVARNKLTVKDLIRYARPSFFGRVFFPENVGQHDGGGLRV